MYKTAITAIMLAAFMTITIPAGKAQFSAANTVVINAETAGDQTPLGVDPYGEGFIVFYESGNSIFAAVISRDGQPTGQEISIAGPRDGDGLLAVHHLANGEFGIFVRGENQSLTLLRRDSNGAHSGTDILMSGRLFADVIRLQDGSFVVWNAASNGGDCFESDIYVRALTSDGRPGGSEVLVGQHRYFGSGSINGESLYAYTAASGNPVVAWPDYVCSGDGTSLTQFTELNRATGTIVRSTQVASTTPAVLANVERFNDGALSYWWDVSSARPSSQIAHDIIAPDFAAENSQPATPVSIGSISNISLSQPSPILIGNSGGAVTAIWSGRSSAGEASQIWLQQTRRDSALLDPVEVAPALDADRYDALHAAANGSSLMVVWEGGETESSDGSGSTVLGRVYLSQQSSDLIAGLPFLVADELNEESSTINILEIAGIDGETVAFYRQSNDIYVRRFTNSGIPLTGDVRLQMPEPSRRDQFVPRTPLAFDNGQYGVLRIGQDGTNMATSGIYLDRFSAIGDPIGSPELVWNSDFDQIDFHSPMHTAFDPASGWLITLRARRSTRADPHIWTFIIDPSGEVLLPPTQTSETPINSAWAPTFPSCCRGAWLSTGQAIIAWDDYDFDQLSSVLRTRVLDSNGHLAQEQSHFIQGNFEAAIRGVNGISEHDFRLFWSVDNYDGRTEPRTLFGRRIVAGPNAGSPPLEIASYRFDGDRHEEIIALNDGSILAVWNSLQQVNVGSPPIEQNIVAVEGIRMNPNGQPIGNIFTVAQGLDPAPLAPHASASDGGAWVAWSDDSGDFDGDQRTGAVARIFAFTGVSDRGDYSVTLADSPGQAADTEFRLVGRSGWLRPGATAFVSSSDEDEDVTVEVRSNGLNSDYLRRLNENNRSSVIRPPIAPQADAYWSSTRPIFIFIDGIDGDLLGSGCQFASNEVDECARDAVYFATDVANSWHLNNSDEEGNINIDNALYDTVDWSGFLAVFGTNPRAIDRSQAIVDATRSIRFNLQKSRESNRPVVIVAHSWGSVIAYQALNILAPELNPDDQLLLVTLGSPLGIGLGEPVGGPRRSLIRRTTRCAIEHPVDAIATSRCVRSTNFPSVLTSEIPHLDGWINIYANEFSEECDHDECTMVRGDIVSSRINVDGVDNYNLMEETNFRNACLETDLTLCHGYYHTNSNGITLIRNTIRTELEELSLSAREVTLGGSARGGSASTAQAAATLFSFPAPSLRTIDTSELNPTLRWSSLCSANGRFRNSQGIMVEAGGYCPRYWVTVATDPSYLPTDPAARSCADPTTPESGGVGCVISLSVDGATDAGGPGSDAIFQVGSLPDNLYGSQRAPLEVGETYYWRVQAFQARGRGADAEIVANGEFSEIGSFTIGGTSADGLSGVSNVRQDRVLTVLQQGSGRGSVSVNGEACPIGQQECVFAFNDGESLVVTGSPEMSIVAGYGIDCNPSGDRRLLVSSCQFDITSNSVVSVRFDLHTLETPALLSPTTSSTTLEDTPLLLWDDVEAADFYLVCVSSSQSDVSNWSPSLNSNWSDGCFNNAVLIGQLYGGSHEIGDQNLIHQPEWGGANPISNNLPSFGTYYWRVIAVNEASGLTAASSVGEFDYIEAVYHDVAINLTGNGEGEVTFFPIQTVCSVSQTDGCSGSVLEGTAIAFAASPSGNSNFGGWDGCDSIEDGICLVTVDGPESIAASFSVPVTTRTLTVNHQGSGSGSILIDPPNRTCTTDCTEDYTSSVSVSLTATPNSGSRAGEWGGACAGTSADAMCSVTMSSSRTLSYRFDLIPDHTLTVATSGVGAGNVTSSPSGISCGADGTDCTEDFEEDTTVTLTAAPNQGSEFASWVAGDCPTPSSSTCQLEMTAARSATARFTLESPPAGRIVAATLPGARSSYVGGPVITAFLSVVSRATTPAQGCRVTASGDAPFTLSYQELNGATPVGPVDPLFDLRNGGSISFIIAMTPTVQTGANGYVFLPQIECENASLTPIEGVSSVLISIGSAPVPDILSIGATSSNDGVVRIPATGNRIAFMAASAVNIGAGDGSGGTNQATVTAAVDTGAAQLPVTLEVCESGPTGCVTPRGATSVQTVFDQNVAETYTVFVRANGSELVPFSPANSRVFLRFTDANGVVRSVTSAAISAPAPEQAAQPAASLAGRWSVLIRQDAGSEPILHRASLYLDESGVGIIDDGVIQRRVAFADVDLTDTQSAAMFAGYPVHLDPTGRLAAGDALNDQPQAFWGVRDVREPQPVNWANFEGPYSGIHITSAGEIRGTLDGCQVYGEVSPSRWANITLHSCDAAGSFIGTIDVPANDNQATLLIANDRYGWRLEAGN